MQSRLSLSVSRVRCTQPSAGAPSRFLTVAILAVLCAGCAVTLISPYDEQIDRGATDLQKEIDGFLTGFESATPASGSASSGHQRSTTTTWSSYERSRSGRKPTPRTSSLSGSSL